MKRTSARLRRIAVVVALSGALPRGARADEAANKASAQALFDDGKELVKAGKYSDACPKFLESQRLDPRISTQFKLADCYEHVGRTASAWVNFLEVASATKAADDAEREKVARSRAQALEPKLSRLTVRVSTPVAGLVVRRDGVVVGEAQWGTPVPIDAGDHALSAEAPGKQAWSSRVRVSGDGATVAAVVPPLEDAPLEPAATKTAPAARTGSPRSDASPETGSGGAQRATGIAASVIGLAGLGVGTAFGVAAMSKQSDSKAYCRSESLCTQPGLDLVDDAKTAASVSTIAFAAGGVLLVTGVVLVVTAPHRAPRASVLGIAPFAATGGAGGLWSGSW